MPLTFQRFGKGGTSRGNKKGARGKVDKMREGSREKRYKKQQENKATQGGCDLQSKNPFPSGLRTNQEKIAHFNCVIT
jgi:hypothetical protein